jgi:hypothetical protein
MNLVIASRPKVGEAIFSSLLSLRKKNLSLEAKRARLDDEVGTGRTVKEFHP